MRGRQPRGPIPATPPRGVQSEHGAPLDALSWKVGWGACACALRALVRDSWCRTAGAGWQLKNWRRWPLWPGASCAAGAAAAAGLVRSSLFRQPFLIFWRWRVGLVYMFNLIVGTGALTMPKAFATAGWLVSLILLVFLGFMSFVTTTFVMEAMAAANAQLHWKRMEIHKEEEEEDSSTASDSDILTQDNYERAEKRPILSVQRRSSANLFEITDRVEMGQMASMFFNKVGVNLFYFCIIIYLYGDLAIYAAAVPLSLMQVTCSVSGNDSCGVDTDTKYNDTDLCWGPLRRVDAYRIYLHPLVLSAPTWFFSALGMIRCREEEENEEGVWVLQGGVTGSGSPPEEAAAVCRLRQCRYIPTLQRIQRADDRASSWKLLFSFTCSSQNWVLGVLRVPCVTHCFEYTLRSAVTQGLSFGPVRVNRICF
ncbi:hypothetical protein U0070_027196, partial [Myodes glareolus]